MNCDLNIINCNPHKMKCKIESNLFTLDLLIEEGIQQIRKGVSTGRKGLGFFLNVDFPAYKFDGVCLRLVQVELAEVIVHKDCPEANAEDHEGDGELHVGGDHKGDFVVGREVPQLASEQNEPQDIESSASTQQD